VDGESCMGIIGGHGIKKKGKTYLSQRRRYSLKIMILKG